MGSKQYTTTHTHKHCVQKKKIQRKKTAIEYWYENFVEKETEVFTRKEWALQKWGYADEIIKRPISLVHGTQGQWWFQKLQRNVTKLSGIVKSMLLLYQAFFACKTQEELNMAFFPVMISISKRNHHSKSYVDFLMPSINHVVALCWLRKN